MTVGELRDLLTQYPDGMEVKCRDSDDRLYDVERVGSVAMRSMSLWESLERNADAAGERVVVIY
ncbi:hypothetical protein [Mycolicibacter heraklionensis]|uniref:hypothetical protein n=1 Tax=Mycolicibacter heraklionensis TaxID=512402 RepID=UPI0007E9C068|nr:hypothetical protein [Mycolicibacter heraklionensis]OBG32401.1 hypothetical protein A5671_07665 [Mycolicibacter heraklionensis]